MRSTRVGWRPRGAAGTFDAPAVPQRVTTRGCRPTPSPPTMRSLARLPLVVAAAAAALALTPAVARACTCIPAPSVDRYDRAAVVLVGRVIDTSAVRWWWPLSHRPMRVAVTAVVKDDGRGVGRTVAVDNAANSSCKWGPPIGATVVIMAQRGPGRRLGTSYCAGNVRLRCAAPLFRDIGRPPPAGAGDCANEGQLPPAPIQPSTAADSLWAAAVAPAIRPLLAEVAVVAVGPDTTRPAPNVVPARSRALAAALARALGVPGPGSTALARDALPVCRTVPESERKGRPRGETASVLWLPGRSPHDGVVRVAFACRVASGRFVQGLDQRVGQRADGSWHPSGPPTHWMH